MKTSRLLMAAIISLASTAIASSALASEPITQGASIEPENANVDESTIEPVAISIDMLELQASLEKDLMDSRQLLKVDLHSQIVKDVTDTLTASTLLK